MGKKLPLGIQSFPKIIEQGYLYVDKTAYIHSLVTRGQLYFLSRPRRFGKSVLLSTLESLFLGKKELFKDLYIENRWDWRPRPVIRLDLLGIESHSREVLERSVNLRLDEQAEAHGLTLKGPGGADRFRELIVNLAEKGPVVVLIDEYDKPILDQISQPEQAEINRKFLSNFYAVLKSVEEKLDFLLLTGVSKFTRVSLFSELNNLTDLTLHPDYAGIAGYTDDEIDHHFSPYLEGPIDGLSGDKLRAQIRKWYNGYSWDGLTRVYNPVSLLQLMDQKIFSSYWFSTGTPTFLIELLRKNMIAVPELAEMEIKEIAMDGFELDRIDPIALLFQTGYLTIISIPKTRRRRFRMGYPNLEVKEAFLTHILANYTEKLPGRAGVLAEDIGALLEEGRIDAFFKALQQLFSSIPYNIFLTNREAYYHTVVYLVLSLMGVDTKSEIQTNRGRIDAVFETQDCYYVAEFKIGTAQEALDQILEKGYAEPYQGKNKEVRLLGVGIDPEQRNIHQWLCQNLNS